MKERNCRKIVPWSFRADFNSDTTIRLASRVFEFAQEAICMTDPEGRIGYVNPAFTHTTGYTSEEALGKNPRVLKSGRHKDDFYKTMWLELTEKGQWQGEIWNKRKNGQIYPETLNIHAVRDEESVLTHYVAIFHDITADVEMRKEVELAGRIQKNILRADFSHEALKMKSIFLPYNHLGGDYYDYRWDEKNQIFRGFLFDVMGHGIVTALQVSALRVLFRQAVERKLSLPGKMHWMNKESISILPEDSFAGALLFEIDILRGQMSYVMAGINHFLLFSKQNPTAGLNVVSQPGLFLGISEQEEYEEHRCELEPGDGVIFLTDGFYDRLLEQNVSLSKLDIPSLMNLLDSLAFQRGLFDDATALGFIR